MLHCILKDATVVAAGFGTLQALQKQLPKPLQSLPVTPVPAVGTACGKNNCMLFVPCHRVLKANGSIGDYRYGARVKKFLLTTEGAIYK